LTKLLAQDGGTRTGGKVGQQKQGVRIPKAFENQENGKGWRVKRSGEIW
jgi:hypothetical protein